VIIHRDLIQQSEQWFRARKGRVTASNADRILTPTGKISSAWKKYAIELTAECVNPYEIPAFTGNKNTDRGNELEPVAREEFAKITGMVVDHIGFLTRDDDIVGCSPDSLLLPPEGSVAAVDHIAGLEIKCPNLSRHAEYVFDGVLPDEYRPQVHFSMAITGLPWYFMSYREDAKPFIVLCKPDGYTKKMSEAIDEFVIYYAKVRKELLPKLIKSKQAEEEIPI
jgi:hypothetical protein